MRARRAGALVAMAGCVLMSVMPPATPARAGGGGVRRPYIVELQAPPLAAYRGEISGYAATSPAVTGRRFDARSSAARRYRVRVDAVEERTLAAAGLEASRPLYSYRTALSGFAARLSRAEADRLRFTPGVARVSPARSYRLAAIDRPSAAEIPPGGESFELLGLPEGIWKQLGGPEHAGEGVVVGVIDGGIYPEHPSFADDGTYRRPADWQGTCQKGEKFSAKDCNGKLIGARWFAESIGVENVLPEDFLSPRDNDGHGSHVAAIAAGNRGVDPNVGGNDLGIGTISGVAPRAHLAVYKACWGEPGCTDPDLVAAVDAAVSDGVDVLNLSLGGFDPDPGPDPLEMALLAATEAGVFVAAAAGNNPPDTRPGSPDSAAWVTSTGASTLGRSFEASATATSGRPDDDPLVIGGKSVTGGLPTTPIVDAATAAGEDVPSADAELCAPEALDPERVRGRVVLCRVDEPGGSLQSEAVAAAGGAGMILYPLEVVSYWDGARRVPTLDVSRADGQTLKELLVSAPRPAITLAAGRVMAAAADVVAEFSTRGPQQWEPDVPKPDVVAPGVAVVSAFIPTALSPSVPGLTFEAWSGTSMAAPHVAGSAALLRQAHPGWSPAAIRSALMTAAHPDLVNHDGSPAGPFDEGSGRIDPTRAANAALVVDLADDDYRRFLEGVDPRIVPGDLEPLRPVDLNLPAVSFSALAGNGATRRTFTSVSDAVVGWRARIEGLHGVTAKVTPAEFALGPGATRSLDLSFIAPGEPTGEYAFGALVLTSPDETTARIPLSVRPVPLAAPPRLDMTTAKDAGSQSFEVQAGFDGQLSAVGVGLSVPQVVAGEEIGTFEGDEFDPNAGPGLRTHDITVTDEAALLRGEITAADGGDSQTDLDLFLFFDDEGDGFDVDDLLEESAFGGSAEGILVPDPAAGQYRFVILGYATRDPVSTYDFTSWLVDDRTPDDPADQPGLVVTRDPAEVKKGDVIPLTVNWSGLEDAPAVYYGWVMYHRTGQPGSEPLGRTLIRIERPGGQASNPEVSRTTSFGSRSSRKPM